MKRKITFCFAIAASVIVCAASFLTSSCSGNESLEDVAPDAFEMTVSSSSVSDGYWLTAVTGSQASPAGGNQSPQLSFSAVENAACYAVYMIDTGSMNWLHWKAVVTKTELAQGETLENSEYVGPYPMSGTHTYTVYVFALAEELDSYPGTVDSFGSGSVSSIARTLDGENANVIGRGSFSAQTERGRRIE